MNLPKADEATVAAFVAALRDEEPDPTLLVNRNCTLRDYDAITAPSFAVDGEFVSYASPDSTYALTKSFLQAATESIVVVQRGLERESYSCTPNCQPSILLGDATKYFSEVGGQAGQRNGMATQR